MIKYSGMVTVSMIRECGHNIVASNQVVASNELVLLSNFIRTHWNLS